MVIGIAMYTANTKERTGVAWYVFHLIKQMASICPSGVILRLYVDRPLVDDFFPLPDCVEVKILKHPLRYAWTHTRLSYELWRHPVDVLFVPSHVLPMYYLRKLKIPMVMTIHDVAAIHIPDVYSWVQRKYSIWSTFYAMLVARAVIVPSKTTAQDVRDSTSIDPKCLGTPIHVVPLAVDVEQHQSVSSETVQLVQKEFGIIAPYFLFIGRLENKKNVQGILEAYTRFRQMSTKHVQLVLVGKKGVGYDDIFSVLESHQYKTDIVFRDTWVSQDVVNALYSGAITCVYPSLYEGFGLNVLEALCYGIPVIVSNSGSLSELGEDCVLRVDANDNQAIADAMLRVCVDDKFCEYVRERGPKYVRGFTWENTAKKTLQILMDVVS